MKPFVICRELTLTTSQVKNLIWIAFERNISADIRTSIRKISLLLWARFCFYADHLLTVWNFQRFIVDKWRHACSCLYISTCYIVLIVEIYWKKLTGLIEFEIHFRKFLKFIISDFVESRLVKPSFNPITPNICKMVIHTLTIWQQKVKNVERVLDHFLDTACLIPVGIYMFKVNNRNTRTKCRICSKLTIKTPERHQCLYC